jgi:hypothetical protein
MDNHGIFVHGRDKRFLFARDVHTGSVAYPASHPVGTEVSLPRYKVAET